MFEVYDKIVKLGMWQSLLWGPLGAYTAVQGALRRCAGAELSAGTRRSRGAPLRLRELMRHECPRGKGRLHKAFQGIV